jgi:CBS domain-containing protein
MSAWIGSWDRHWVAWSDGGEKLKVGELLLQKGHAVYYVGSSQSIREVVSILAGSAIGAVAVVDHGSHIDGIVSERDIVKAIDASGADALDMTVKDVMSCDVLTCNSETLVADVVTMMKDYGVRHMPVVGENTLEGMVSIRDLVNIRIADLEQEVEDLKAQQSGQQ